MLKQNGLVGDASAQRAKSRGFIFPDPLAFTQVSQEIGRIFDIDDHVFWGDGANLKTGVLSRQQKYLSLPCRGYRTLSLEDCGTLPRSGYTKQPRALALGKWLVKSALKVAPD